MTTTRRKKKPSPKPKTLSGSRTWFLGKIYLVKEGGRQEYFFSVGGDTPAELVTDLRNRLSEKWIRYERGMSQ